MKILELDLLKMVWDMICLFEIMFCFKIYGCAIDVKNWEYGHLYILQVGYISWSNAPESSRSIHSATWHHFVIY